MPTAQADAVAPRIANLAHPLVILDVHRPSIESCPNGLEVCQCSVEVRHLPIHDGSRRPTGHLPVARNDLEPDLAHHQAFEPDRLNALANGSGERAFVPGKTRLHIRYMDQDGGYDWRGHDGGSTPK